MNTFLKFKPSLSLLSLNTAKHLATYFSKTLCLIVLFINYSYATGVPALAINEVSFGEWRFTSGDGIYGIGWIELKNNTDSTIEVRDVFLSTDKDSPWKLPEVNIAPGSYYFIWLSGKDTVTSMGDPHASFSLSDSTKYIKLFRAQRNLTLDSIAINAPPVWNGTYGRCQDGSSEWCYFTSTTPGSANLTLGVWQNIATQTQFYPRDSSPNAALYYKSKHWILEGWEGGGGESASFSNSWSSVDGLNWTLENDSPPYEPYSAYIVFRDKMWAFSNDAYSSTDGKVWTRVADNLPFGKHARVVEFNSELFIIKGTSIWRSEDGVEWHEVTHAAPWPTREFPGLLAFNDRLWFFGGGINYDTGDDEYFNDVWVSDDGVTWDLVTEHAEWEGRYWFGFATFDDKMWLLGGWNYHDKGDNFFGNKNDVWYTENGSTWQPLLSSYTWRPRHAPFVWADTASLWVSSGYLNTTGLMNDVWRIEKFDNILKDYYYLKPGAKVTELSSWGTNPDGSGIEPKNFDMDFQTFAVCNTDSIHLDTTWQVAGINSAVLIGNDEEPIYFEVSGDNKLNASIELKNKAVLSLSNGISTTIINSHENSEVIVRQGSGLSHLDAIDVGRLTLESDSILLVRSTFVKHGILFDGRAIVGDGRQFAYDVNTFLDFRSKNLPSTTNILWPKNNSPSTIFLDLDGTIVVNGDVSIDSLVLKKGKLEVVQGTVKVGNVSGAKSSSYIVTSSDGAVEIMKHENSFYFPIGTSYSYNPLKVTPQNDSESHLTASVHEVDTLQDANHSVNVIWKIHGPQGFAESYLVEVHWESSNLGEFADETHLVLTTYVSGQWLESMDSQATLTLNEAHSVAGVVNGILISVQDIHANDPDFPLTVFPNPTTGPLNILFNHAISSGSDIVLYDMAGRQKMRIGIEKGMHTLTMNSFSTLDAGSYILKVTLDGKTYNRHIIIL